MGVAQTNASRSHRGRDTPAEPQAHDGYKRCGCQRQHTNSCAWLRRPAAGQPQAAAAGRGGSLRSRATSAFGPWRPHLLLSAGSAAGADGNATSEKQQWVLCASRPDNGPFQWRPMRMRCTVTCDAIGARARRSASHSVSWLPPPAHGAGSSRRASASPPAASQQSAWL